MSRPHDPLDVLAWVQERRAELDRIERRALFNARMQGRFDEALRLAGLSRKRGLALTRAENSARGRMVRWGQR